MRRTTSVSDVDETSDRAFRAAPAPRESCTALRCIRSRSGRRAKARLVSAAACVDDREPRHAEHDVVILETPRSRPAMIERMDHRANLLRYRHPTPQMPHISSPSPPRHCRPRHTGRAKSRTRAATVRSALRNGDVCSSRQRIVRVEYGPLREQLTTDWKDAVVIDKR